MTKRFANRDALVDASLSVAEGEVVAVTGPSGAGKSTLLHIASGVLAADSGVVVLGGHDLAGMSLPLRTALRRLMVGFVFQSGLLIPELNAVDNVALPLLFAGRRRADARREARSLIADLGIADVAGQRPDAMSGGQAQRVAVARALVHGPRVIFADEPTGALDSQSSEVVMRLLVAEVKSRGAALVVVTHDPSVAAWADRNVIVKDGRTSGVGR